jgi:ubiquinone/menaquinone biosynthesis C-methylase UbiE
MAVIDNLTSAEQARHLREPEGDIGLAIAEFLNANNRQGNARTVALLGLQRGDRVLEVGFGNGRTVPDVMGRATDLKYAGVDISRTMVDEAARFNAALVAAGAASFHLASAEELPFADGTFDRVYSTGVVHFWAAPATPLAEVRRVMTAGGLMIMGCLAATAPPDFARAEFGFYLREPAEWDALCRAAGFNDVLVEALEAAGINPDGAPVKRHAIRITTRA